MDLEWPPLQGELLTKLKSCFASPRQLHYDFDDSEGARKLVEVLVPGLGAGNVQLAVDQLVKWHKEGASSVLRAKRIARAGLSESLVGQHTVSASTISEAYDKLAHSNPLSLLPAIERARKARENSVDPSKRAAEERAAKAKYATLLYSFLVEARAPIVDILKEVTDSEEACVRIFGTRRSKTLRNRFHSWSKFARWLETSKGRVWPAGLQDLLDYATEAVKEGAGKTTIDSFSAALSVLEQVGRFGEGDMLSRDPTWISYSKNVTAELVEKGPMLHQAAQPTVAMALSLELYVFDEDRARYARALAFVALLMLWGSMRSDDVQCMRPESMRLTIEGLSCKLWKTKTTGPDRRINMVQVFISRKASFSGLDWLAKGHEIWSEIKDKRDFLVLQASEDWETCGNKGVDAPAVSLYVRKIYKELCVPRWVEGRWIQNKERLLLPGDCALHFSGHSARNFLTSIAAAIRVPKDDRDFLGRWKVGGGGSADYTRTARQIVHRIQEQVAETVLLGRERGYVEADALDALQSFAEERGEIGAVVRARHELVRANKVGGNPRLGGRYPPLYMQSIPGPHVITEEAAEDQPETAAAPKGEAKYFISVSKKTGMAVTEAEMRERVNSVDADLQYVLQEAIADDRAGSRTAANTDFGVPRDTPAGRQQTAAIVAAWELAKEISSKEIELRAEARALNQPRILQTQERQAMLRAVSAAYGKLNEAETPSAEYLALKAEETEQNEPTAAQLDTITSKRDSQTATIQSSVDPAGHLRITKTKQKVEMPQNSEAYRRVLKIEGYSWLAMQSRYKSKTWLQGLTMADFTKFVDYILGERVAGLRLEQATGYDSSQNALFRPPWGIVLRYEYKLRKEAFRLVNDEGQTLQDALAAVTKDTELKEVHFVTPLTLTAFPMPSKWTRRGEKGDKGGKGKDPRTGKGKQGKGKGEEKGAFRGLQLVWRTPDGKDICFAYNNQGCQGNCGSFRKATTKPSDGGCFVLESPEDLGATKAPCAEDIIRLYEALPKEVSKFPRLDEPTSDLGRLYERALSEASVQLAGQATLKLPWEKGIYAEIFSGSELPRMPTLPVPATLPVVDVARPGTQHSEALKQTSDPLPKFESAVYKHCLHKSTIAAGGRPGTDRDAVYRRWLCILGHNLAGSKIGEYIADGAEDPLVLIADTFGGKSTSTLLKRARFVARMLTWASEHSQTFFPLRLGPLLSFMRSLTSESAKAQCGETINFLVHVLGVHADLDILKHPVIQGLLRGSRSTGKEIKQSRVLTVREVMALEDMLSDASLDPVDRYGAGVFLFQIYSRARVSDIRNIQRFELDLSGDDGYLEAKTMDHKNATRGRGLGQSLILVAPVQGLRDKAWGIQFIEVAKMVGFNLRQGNNPLLDDEGESSQESKAEVTDPLILAAEQFRFGDPDEIIDTGGDVGSEHEPLLEEGKPADNCDAEPEQDAEDSDSSTSSSSGSSDDHAEAYESFASDAALDCAVPHLNKEVDLDLVVFIEDGEGYGLVEGFGPAQHIAVFLERCETAGLPTPIRDILVGKNLSTLAGLAFAAGQPGETPSDAALTGLARSGTEEVPIATLASLRRLVFEAQLLMTAQVKMLIEHRADDQKAELAPAERSERIQKQSERLAGVALRNESECSYGSYDLVMKMVQENCVSYLSPARFPSRQAELRLEKPRKELDVVNSKITLKDQAVDLQCQLHTPLCLHHALHRRALAMDLVGVASYSVSMEFHEYLMSHLTMEPPPGYHQVTLHQVLAADRAAWLRLAEKLPKGLRAGPDGKLPLDIELPKLQGDPKVAFHLLPLGPSASSSGKRSMDGDQGQNNDSKIQRTGGKGKGKGKTKTKAFPKSMPVSLKDKWSRTKRGVPICWAFNTEEGCCDLIESLEVFLNRARARVTGVSIEALFGVEVFAGSGRLTCELRRLGLNDSIGVDKNVGRCLIAPVLRLDLGDEQARELVVQMLENPNCAYVHVSPPALNQKHRSLKHRDGADASCYSASCSLLYEFCGKLFSMCWSKGILFSCENPGQSELWRTPQWCKHTLCLNSIDTVFHMCMWGSLSPRFTRIVHSVPSLTQLGVRCCGVSSSHTHESRNALHDSTFPLDLSRAWANAIVEQLVALGALPRARSLDESRAPLHREAQVAAASQPTRKKVPPLVSEFRCVATIDTPKPFLDTASKKLEGPIPIPAGAKCDTTLTVLPAGSRVIRRQLLGVSSPALKLDVGSETSNPTSGRVASFPEVSKPKPDRVQVCSEATHPAEAFAASCLKLGYIDPGKISEFTQLLESELPARGDGGQHEFSFTVGSFVHGGIYGLRTSSVNFPLTTQVLARFMRQQCPDAVFTSLALMRDVQTTLHIDTNNSLPYLNTVAKVTNFEEGGLWVHNDHGDMPCPDANFGQLMGTKVDFENGLTGLRKACHDFPLATKCLVRFVRSMRPFHPFSTISIYDNVCTALHKDSRNACCENLIIPLTQFSGGELWMQQDKGATPQDFGGSEVFGTAVPIPPEGLCFDARGILHCTMPWKGRRLIAVAFTVSKTEELKQSDARLLEDLGINCPSASQLTGRTLDAGELSSTESSESEPPSGGGDQQADDVFRPELCGNFGNPLMLEWDGRESPITDGYGLCSPTRWHPASRGASLPEKSKDLSRRLNGLVQQFVAEQVPDCQLLALKLATGQILESPFEEGAMRRLREDWAALVCETDGAKHEGLLEVAGFRTDAKCADGFVVLAGWELSDDTKSSKWFSLRLTPSDAPYLFDQEGKSQWASGSAELLATLAALHVFGYLTASVDRKELDVECAADTDNQGNSRLLKKGSSTKWPLMLINMQLSDLLLRSSLKLLLRWRPRDENQYADQLTNEIFTNFSDEHRIACTYSDLPLALLHQLWETKENFDSARRAQAVLQQDASGHRPQKRKAEKTPW
ncbi:unnamed protein product [Symbiodinium sp. CCMP2592]|nr:unnamed protein product [Symbiodinium sp. CCMP2592]